MPFIIENKKRKKDQLNQRFYQQMLLAEQMKQKLMTLTQQYAYYEKILLLKEVEKIKQLNLSYINGYEENAEAQKQVLPEKAFYKIAQDPKEQFRLTYTLKGLQQKNDKRVGELNSLIGFLKEVKQILEREGEGCFNCYKLGGYCGYFVALEDLKKLDNKQQSGTLFFVYQTMHMQPVSYAISFRLKPAVSHLKGTLYASSGIRKNHIIHFDTVPEALFLVGDFKYFSYLKQYLMQQFGIQLNAITISVASDCYSRSFIEKFDCLGRVNEKGTYKENHLFYKQIDFISAFSKSNEYVDFGSLLF